MFQPRRWDLAVSVLFGLFFWEGREKKGGQFSKCLLSSRLSFIPLDV